MQLLMVTVGHWTFSGQIPLLCVVYLSNALVNGGGGGGCGGGALMQIAIGYPTNF